MVAIIVNKFTARPLQAAISHKNYNSSTGSSSWRGPHPADLSFLLLSGLPMTKPILQNITYLSTSLKQRLISSPHEIPTVTLRGISPCWVKTEDDNSYFLPAAGIFHACDNSEFPEFSQ